MQKEKNDVSEIASGGLLNQALKHTPAISTQSPSQRLPASSLPACDTVFPRLHSFSASLS